VTWKLENRPWEFGGRSCQRPSGDDGSLHGNDRRGEHEDRLAKSRLSILVEVEFAAKSVTRLNFVCSSYEF